MTWREQLPIRLRHWLTRHPGDVRRVRGFRVIVESSRAEAREERLCRRAEIAFGKALPSEWGVPVIERAQATLALEDADVAPAIDWTVAQARIDSADNSAAGPSGPA